MAFKQNSISATGAATGYMLVENLGKRTSLWSVFSQRNSSPKGKEGVPKVPNFTASSSLFLVLFFFFFLNLARNV